MNKQAKAKFLAGGVLVGVIGLAPLPATAHGSPPPKVRISQLSEPTIGPEGQKVYTFGVIARDPDGIIEGLTVEIVGDGFHEGRAVLGTCAPDMEPGGRFDIPISVSLPGAGTYRVEARATSISSCDELGVRQSSRPTARRFAVRS